MLRCGRCDSYEIKRGEISVKRFRIYCKNCSRYSTLSAESVGLFSDVADVEVVCLGCGSGDCKRAGYKVNARDIYLIYRCRACGGGCVLERDQLLTDIESIRELHGMLNEHIHPTMTMRRLRDQKLIVKRRAGTCYMGHFVGILVPEGLVGDSAKLLAYYLDSSGISPKEFCGLTNLPMLLIENILRNSKQGISEGLSRHFELATGVPGSIWRSR